MRIFDELDRAEANVARQRKQIAELRSLLLWWFSHASLPPEYDAEKVEATMAMLSPLLEEGDEEQRP